MIFYWSGSPGLETDCRYILQDFFFICSYIYIITYIYVEFYSNKNKQNALLNILNRKEIWCYFIKLKEVTTGICSFLMDK